MNVWRFILDSLAKGERPSVLLGKPFMEPKRVGRPKKERPVAFTPPIEGRNGGSPYLRAKKSRCWNPHCKKQLAMRYVCGDVCEKAAIDYFETALALLRPEQPEEEKEVPDVQDYERIRSAEIANFDREEGRDHSGNGEAGLGR